MEPTERELPTDPARIVLIIPTRHALKNDHNENPNHEEALTDIRYPRRNSRPPAQDPIRTRTAIDRKLPSLTNERTLLELPSFALSRIEIELITRTADKLYRLCCLDARHHYHEPRCDHRRVRRLLLSMGTCQPSGFARTTSLRSSRR